MPLRTVRAALPATLLAVHALAETITVPAGGDFQEALYQAQPGGVIALEAGATLRAAPEWNAD